MTSQLMSRSTDLAATAVEELLNRRLPQAREAFGLLISTDLPGDTFELGSDDDGALITVRGADNVAVAAGLNWYLKHYARVQFPWSGDPLHLPRLSGTVRITSPYRWRYYFNYCTFSYSMAFWDWQRWEREIDWMALSGINLPLAIIGQEAVWQRVYREMGLNDQELGNFFAGPAFLAWGWMGNIDGWNGPSPQSWIDGQCQLQKKILRRMRSLDIKPVLPAFTGHVPPALTDHFPAANIRQMKNWAETFPGTYLLDPTDPLFGRIGASFIRHQMDLYGTDREAPHFYSCDTFNENSPPDNDPAYLDAVSRSLYGAMSAADPDATWVLQDWMFHFNPTDPGFWRLPQIHAFLDAIPDERLLVLDLHSDAFPLGPATDNLCGKPWVWCYLHSFGGRQAMFGNLRRLAHDPSAALDDPKSGKLVGFGLTPEGIEQNPVLYDLATDLIWRREAPDVDGWISGYLRRRYGAESKAALRAWRILEQTVYARPVKCGATVSTPVNYPPNLHGHGIALSYQPSDLIPAWKHLLDAASILRASDSFCFDLVDVGRQVLVNFGAAIQQEAAIAFAEKDVNRFKTVGNHMVELIHDLDRLLGTRREFLLGVWLESAKAWGTNPQEVRLMEENARRQITLWGDHTSMLRDYGRKDWSGSMRAFYAVRWQRFFDRATECLQTSEAFDQAAFQRELRLWEEQWIHQRELYPTSSTGDAVSISAELFAKYSKLFPEFYKKYPSLSMSKPTAASGSAPGHGPELAVSGMANRYVCWTSRQRADWWQVDLQSVTMIDTVHLFTYWGDDRAYQYRIQTSLDEQTWSVAVDAMSNVMPSTPQGMVHQFDACLARFVRIVVQGNSVNSHGHLMDVRVYGPDCPFDNRQHAPTRES